LRFGRLIAFVTSGLCVSVSFGNPTLCLSQKASTIPSLSAGFADPPRSARPQIRLWTPGAAVSDAGLRADIDTIAQLGFGGLEIDAFAAPAKVGDGLDWGSEAWSHLMNTAAAQAARDGISVDFTNGANGPIALPAVKSADDPGALYELTYGSLVLKPGESYSGLVPPRRKIRRQGTTHLAAVLAYRLVGDKTLDASSIVDLTARTRIDATDNGKSSIEFTAPSEPNSWVLFSFWEQPAGQKVGRYYVIDHFSTAGAQASSEHWDRVALPALGKEVKSVRSIFNDSLEYEVAMEWTRGMREIFKQQHGYDITPFLPFIGVAATYPANDIPAYKTAVNDLGQKVEHDYRQTLTTLYIENHLKPMERMAERHGLSVRYQVAYNKPMQIEDSALAVAIPENEALGRSSLDMQRYMAGAVHLQGKPLYSIETSAELQNEYGQSLQDIVWWNKRAWATGVNVQRLHGESYSGQFDGPGNTAGQLPGQKWPGYSAFRSFFSNNWTRQTSPESLRHVLAYMARTNYVMQKNARVDLAIYDDSPDIYVDKFKMHGDGSAVYPDGGVLNANGFSYDFVSPDLLDLPQFKVNNGRLDVDGPAYKALIIHDQEAMTAHVVQRLSELANAGLKIVFVGDLPGRNVSHADQLRGHSDADIGAGIAQLLLLPTVARVADYASVPVALGRLNVRADAEPASPVDILTQHRTDATGDYYYLYNYNKVSNADDTLLGQSKDHTKYPDLDKKANFSPKAAQYSLAGTGRSYLLNAWTGKITQMPQFTSLNGHVSVTVHLTGDESMLIALLSDQQAKRAGVEPFTEWATESNVPAGDLAYTDGGKLAFKATQKGSYTVRLNSGRSVTETVSDVEAPRTIRDWSLSIKAVAAPTNGSTLFQDSAWQTFGPFRLGEKLKPWNQIDSSLARVSGVATYSGTFMLTSGWEQGGSAYADLGELDDSFTVMANGKQLLQQDQVKTSVDLGRYAQSGINSVVVQVATTLYNSVVAPGKLYGLLGTNGVVTVTPYRFRIIGSENRKPRSHAASATRER
jgi:alpha-L-rhamnosidase